MKDSRFEQIVKVALNRDVDEVIEGLTPLRATSTTVASKSPDGHLSRRPTRWLLPIAAAAVIVLLIGGVVVLRQTHEKPLSAAGRSTASSSTTAQPDVHFAGTTTSAGQALAIAEITDRRNGKAPGGPSVSATLVPETPIVQALSLVSASQLKVSFIGTVTPGGQDCGYNYSLGIAYTSDYVGILVDANPGNWPSGANANCAYTTETKVLTISLSAPLGQRVVFDISNDQNLTFT